VNFDRLAPHYDWMEAVTAGGLLQRARTHWMGELSGCRRVLSVGEGHGRFAAAFLQSVPEAKLTCIEACARMAARARRRIDRIPGAAGRVEMVVADVRQWKAPADAGGFDGVVTCFFLDCFEPETLARVVERLAAGAAPECRWLNVDFALPARPGFWRWRAAVVHALMYWFFRQAVGLPARRLTVPDPLLQKAGFRLVGRAEFDRGLVRADLWRRAGSAPSAQ